jgi:hypothetical protein
MNRNYRVNRWLDDHGISEIILTVIGVTSGLLLMRLPWPWTIAGIAPAVAFVAGRGAYYFALSRGGRP